ncbi:Vacuolar protein sorting-associated protein 33A [Blomia tropicalis]|nr:Vacuolar protein sorting-associated protein 33A [Blomia tropicalis]
MESSNCDTTVRMYVQISETIASLKTINTNADNGQYLFNMGLTNSNLQYLNAMFNTFPKTGVYDHTKSQQHHKQQQHQPITIRALARTLDSKIKAGIDNLKVPKSNKLENTPAVRTNPTSGGSIWQPNDGNGQNGKVKTDRKGYAADYNALDIPRGYGPGVDHLDSRTNPDPKPYDLPPSQFMIPMESMVPYQAEPMMAQIATVPMMAPMTTTPLMTPFSTGTIIAPMQASQMMTSMSVAPLPPPTAFTSCPNQMQAPVVFNEPLSPIIREQVPVPVEVPVVREVPVERVVPVPFVQHVPVPFEVPVDRIVQVNRPVIRHVPVPQPVPVIHPVTVERPVFIERKVPVPEPMPLALPCAPMMRMEPKGYPMATFKQRFMAPFKTNGRVGRLFRSVTYFKSGHKPAFRLFSKEPLPMILNTRNLMIHPGKPVGIVIYSIMYRSIFKLTKNINYFVTNPIYRYNQISKQTLAATCHDALFQSKRTFSSDSMEKEFQTAVANLQKVSTDVDNDKKLKLYALYKQATNGPCSDEKPSMFNVVDKAKWQAWKALGDQSSDDAKKDYISIVNELLAASGASEESSKQEPDIVFESKNHVYTIRLNRPKQYNAITPEIYEGIIDALKRAGEDPDIKFVVITGTGKYFSSGNDLKNFTKGLQAAGGDMEKATSMARDTLFRFVSAFIDFPKPLIGVINGPAFGIMFTTLALYDCIIASDTASFTCPFSSLGQSPEGCSTYTFPRIFGQSLASELLYFNYVMPVEEAHRRGFVSRIIQKDKLESHVEEWLHGEKGLVATCYPNSMINAKNLVLNEETRLMLQQINKHEADVLQQSWNSEECMEALQKFYTQMSHLNSGRLNLSSIRDVSRSVLFSLLDSIEGTKSMVWDSKLIGPFGLISDYGLLKEHKIVQMLELRGGRLLSNISAQNVIYFIRPKSAFMDIISENILQESVSRLSNINLHIIFVPYKSVICERQLQFLGVFGDISSINEYSPDFYVFDSDVISIEWPLSYKECNLESDFSSLYQSARALMTLQCLYGIIPSITGIGFAARTVWNVMARMRREMQGIEPSIVPQFDHLILIDRSIDTLTPMVQQLNYEGLLDEIYGINQTVIELPPDKFVQNNQDDITNAGTSVQNVEPPTEKKRFQLNSAEDLFKKLRDSNHLSVGPILHSSAKSLAAQFDERKFAKTVREIRQFVDKIPFLQKLRSSQANHTSMAELIREHTNTEEFQELLFYENEILNGIDTDEINPYIENCINKSESLFKILRLIAIQSFCGNGLKRKVYDFYKREIVQTYGYEHMLSLSRIEHAGLIRVSGGAGWSGRSYSMIRNRLKLTWDINGASGGANSNASPDIGHVHNGYTPLTVRIVQQLEQFGYRSLSDVLSRLLLRQNVPIFDDIQQLPPTLRKRRNSDTTSLQSSAEMNQKLVLIFFLGGCTFSEISSLRCLSHKDSVNTDFIVATTSIINGNTFIQSLTKLDFPNIS